MKIINNFDTKPVVNEQDVVDRMKAFVENHGKEIKHYGVLKKVEDMERYLMKESHLVCEETANQLVIWCIDLAVEEVCLSIPCSGTQRIRQTGISGGAPSNGMIRILHLGSSKNNNKIKYELLKCGLV